MLRKSNRQTASKQEPVEAHLQIYTNVLPLLAALRSTKVSAEITYSDDMAGGYFATFSDPEQLKAVLPALVQHLGRSFNVTLSRSSKSADTKPWKTALESVGLEHDSSTGMFHVPDVDDGVRLAQVMYKQRATNKAFKFMEVHWNVNDPKSLADLEKLIENSDLVVVQKEDLPAKLAKWLRLVPKKMAGFPVWVWQAED